MPVLPSFYAPYPDVQVHMGVSDRRVDLVGEGVDCVIRSGELLLFSEDWPLEPLPVVVAFPSSHHPSAKVRGFVEWVAE